MSQGTWLTVQTTTNSSAAYHHSLFVETPTGWDYHKNELIEYFKLAHTDTLRHLSVLTETSLHPAGSLLPPYDDYPHKLPEITLQGYFGEVLSGYLAERVSACGLSEWKVPAHLFRFHDQAFQFLEQRSQTGHSASALFGRTGDDCLAFRRDQGGVITAVLFCEAKCTKSHDASLIQDAHVKLSASAIVSILQLIDILKDRGDGDAAEWINSLRHFHFALHSKKQASIPRYDLCCYVHSATPVRKSTWIDRKNPHTSYTARRPLAAYEVRLSDVSARIAEVYAEACWR